MKCPHGYQEGEHHWYGCMKVNPFKEGTLMDMRDLNAAVEKRLIMDHDFTEDEAAVLIQESMTSNPEIWHENSDIAELAKSLAFDGDDD